MALSGLCMLQLQDRSGRILSAGHFRQDYGRVDPIARALTGRDDAVLAQYRTPGGVRLALVRHVSFEMAGEQYHWVGGVDPESIPWLEDDQRIGHLEARLRLPGADAGESDAEGAGGSAVPSTDESIVAVIPLPFLAAGSTRVEQAGIEIRRIEESAATVALRHLDGWFVGYLILALAGAGLLAFAVSAWISRPLRDLAEKTTRVHLRHSRVRFVSERHDEVGDLTRFVGGMVDRLQEAAGQLQEAERRATLGDLARQVNHDVKNGVTPLRNVLRHLGQLVESDPESLPRVFAERRSTLESSLAYLEELASNYARLSPRQQARPVEVNGILQQVGEAQLLPNGVDVTLRLAKGELWVAADPLGFRRIIENLVRNAVDASARRGGTVVVRSERAVEGTGAIDTAAGASRGIVRISVSDSGPGISVEERSRIFEHFYTTKAQGTGLGLSIVKRLVADFGGRLEIESESGRGATFTVTLPETEARGTSDETLPPHGRNG
ncbi:MAG: HAMP domain-containing sensor histidine kinase [Candidatus Eisenbacteria bacterium]